MRTDIFTRQDQDYWAPVYRFAGQVIWGLRPVSWWNMSIFAMAAPSLGTTLHPWLALNLVRWLGALQYQFEHEFGAKVGQQQKANPVKVQRIAAAPRQPQACRPHSSSA